MYFTDEWEQNTQQSFYVEKALLAALAGGASTSQEIVSAAKEILLKKQYEDISPLYMRLILLRLLQRNEFVKKESGNSYAITNAGQEFLKSPLSSSELAANYVRGLIEKKGAVVCIK